MRLWKKFLQRNGRPQPGENFSEIRDFRRIREFFGRTGLSISLSRAKFDEQADFDIRSAVARPKPRQMGEKQNFRSDFFGRKFFFGVEKRNVRNRPKRVLAKFRANRSRPRRLQV